MNITELKQHWEAWRKSRKVAINSKLIEGIDALLADHESIAKQNAAMREALENHHAHASEDCEVWFNEPLPDGKAIAIPFPTNLGEAYQESALCEQTLAALSTYAGRDYVSKERVLEIVKEELDVHFGQEDITA